ncbi:hypothetical protein BD410DRAFT_871895, partial [Rickenella mellea]
WFTSPSTTTTPSPTQRTPTPTTTGARIKNPYGRHSTPRTNSNSDTEAVRQPVAAVGVNTPTVHIHLSPSTPPAPRPAIVRAPPGAPKHRAGGDPCKRERSEGAHARRDGGSGSGRAGNSGGTAHPQGRCGCARGERPRLGGGGGDYGAPAVSRSKPNHPSAALPYLGAAEATYRRPARLLLHM